jgi:hypothetical protein
MFCRSARLFLLLVLFVFCGGLSSGIFWPAHANLQSPQDFSPTSVPVLVSDFELFSSATSSPDSGSSDSSTKSVAKDGPPTVFDPSDAAPLQARRLMDFFSTTLAQDLKKSGYSATRQQGHAQQDKGVQIRGVFAEPDAKNRIRRAMLGGGSPGVTMLLYVGIFNLARPDQPLYQPATEQNPDARYGPIITMNNYVPLAKFELSKNPSEQEVRKICIQIVENLSNLLRTNPTAFAQ